MTDLPLCDFDADRIFNMATIKGHTLVKCLYQVRAIAVFQVFRLLTDFVCLLTYEFCLSLWKIARCSVILLLPLLFLMKWWVK
jgi:hypothetical protein